MKRAWPIGATVVVLIAAWLATSPAIRSTVQAAPARASARVKTVTLVLAPYLTWGDISPTATPALMRLAEQGAVANINARSHARQQGQPAAPIECALAISAGAWAVPQWSAPAAFDATEPFPGGGTGADAYRRVFGRDLGSAPIAYLGQPMTQRANDVASLDVELGTLGQAVRDAGGLTAAIGNSDTGDAGADLLRQRPAAVAAADKSGAVLLGDVSESLLTTAAAAPYGRHTDLAAFGAALGQVRLQESAHQGPFLAVLDAGDANRAHEFEWQVAEPVAESQHADAVRELDSVVGMVDAQRGPGDVVIVASQALAVDQNGTLQGLGPFIVAGPGFSGFATSSSTHRSGIVTNLDVPATVLAALGIRRPVAVLGNPVTVTPSEAPALGRISLLVRDNSTAIAVDSLKSAVHNSLIWSVVAVLALTAFVVWRARVWRPRSRARATRALEGAVLLVLSLPVANTLMFAFARWPSGGTEALAAFYASAALAWVCALLVARQFSARVAAIALAVTAALGFVGDQLAGAPLSFTSFLGYSPLVGARFYGMGNEIASLLFGAALVALGLAIDNWPRAGLATWLRRFGVPLAGVLVVVVAAAPMLGANVGVAVWGTAGFGLAWALANGRGVSWRLALGIALTVVLVVAAFSAIDLLRAGDQTHLGRALASAQEGGVSTLMTIVSRKAEANASVLANTDLTWILVATLGLFAFARWRRGSDWQDLLAENPGFMAMSLAAAVGGAVAFFSEDSGIAIPSLIAVYVGLALAIGLIEHVKGGEPA